MKVKGECSINGCGMPVKTRGLCGACYSWCRKLEIMGAYHRKAYMQRLAFRTQRMMVRAGLVSGGKILQFKRIA